jgi:hypothetical protein
MDAESSAYGDAGTMGQVEAEAAWAFCLSGKTPIAVTEGHIDGALSAPQIEGFAGADRELYAHIGVH